MIIKNIKIAFFDRHQEIKKNMLDVFFADSIYMLIFDSFVCRGAASDIYVFQFNAI